MAALQPRSLQNREMLQPPRKYRLGARQRLAVQLLADSPFGATETAMFVNGFTRKMLVHLIRAGLATTERENLKGVYRPRQDH
jgi:hypothetical protein